MKSAWRASRQLLPKQLPGLRSFAGDQLCQVTAHVSEFSKCAGGATELTGFELPVNTFSHESANRGAACVALRIDSDVTLMSGITHRSF